MDAVDLADICDVVVPSREKHPTPPKQICGPDRLPPETVDVDETALNEREDKVDDDEVIEDTLDIDTKTGVELVISGVGVKCDVAGSRLTTVVESVDCTIVVGDDEKLMGDVDDNVKRASENEDLVVKIDAYSKEDDS